MSKVASQFVAAQLQVQVGYLICDPFNVPHLNIAIVMTLTVFKSLHN